MISSGLILIENFIKMWSSCEVATWIFGETVYHNPSKHVMIIPSQCRWHDIGYVLSVVSYEQVTLPPDLTFLPLYGLEWASCDLSQPTASGEPATGTWWLKLDFSLLWELCGLTEAQCAVDNTVFMEGLVLWIWFFSWFGTQAPLLTTVHIVLEQLFPCINCGMILVTQLFVLVLGLMLLSISTFCIQLHCFSSRSF
jgi:hypothetical protein